jgi:hypothetical protein
MSSQNTEAPAMQAQEESEKQDTTPQASTPLERVRAGQAKMRGNRLGLGRSSQDGEATASVDSYKRRQHQRKSG